MAFDNICADPSRPFAHISGSMPREFLPSTMPATQKPGKSAARKRKPRAKRECKFIDSGAEESDADKRSSGDEEIGSEQETEADKLFIDDGSDVDTEPELRRRKKLRGKAHRKRVFQGKPSSRELDEDDLDLIRMNAGIKESTKEVEEERNSDEVCGCYADSDEDGVCEEDEGFVVMSKEEKAAVEAGIQAAAALKQMRKSAGWLSLLFSLFTIDRS